MNTLTRTTITCFLCLLACATYSQPTDDFTQAELTSLGLAYTQAVNALNVDTLNVLVSSRHLGKKAADIAGDSAADKREFAAAFANAIATLNKNTIGALEREGVEARFIRVHMMNGLRGPLIRLSVGDAYNYVFIEPARADGDKNSVRIGDIFYATTGEWLSTTLGVTARLMAKPSETFLGKIFGSTAVDKDIAEQFVQLAKLRQQSEYQKAYDLLSAFDENTRNDRLVLINSIGIAAQISDELHVKELNRMAKHHQGDPRAAFMLLDHYFYVENYDAAIAVIDVMEKSYGLDAVMKIFRSNVEAERGRPEPALQFAREAVELEPDFEDAYWTLVSVLVSLNDYDECVKVFHILEREFGYEFSKDSFAEDPFYAGFTKSSAFNAWFHNN